MSGIKAQFKIDPVCRECNHKENDSWDFRLDNGLNRFSIECSNCGENYTFIVDVSFKYELDAD